MENITKFIEEITSGITNFFRGTVSGRTNLSNPKSSFGRRARLFEINLVPDIKAAAIKSQKLRNLCLFLFLVVSGSAVAIFLILGTVVATQNVTIKSQETTAKSLDSKIRSFNSLNELLTIQGQLNKISEINSQKRSLYRTFYILSALLAQGPDEKGNKDKISVSEMSVDLDQSVINIEAQADAGKEPYIDYRVLEAFKKASYATNYDYGNYVDENGKIIPSYCIEEATSDGTLFVEGGNLYGKWYKKEKGCDPSAGNTSEKDKEPEKPTDNDRTQEEKETEVLSEYIKKLEEDRLGEQKQANKDDKEDKDKKDKVDKIKQADKNSQAIKKRFSTEPVKIWRIPKFEEWQQGGFMDDSGKISGVPHFESKCVKYNQVSAGEQTRWQAKNQCMLLKKPVEVIDSNNARNTNGNLVLRFSAKLYINPEVFLFKNKHVIPLSPSAQNVTDSYTQVDNIFEQRASDCRGGDSSCGENKKRSNEK